MIPEQRIDFKQLAKPANLQNSAVLRMLEEEEDRKRAGKAGLKRVAWPPPPEEQGADYIEQEPVQVKTRGTGEYATYQNQKSPASSVRADSPAIVQHQTQLPPQSPQPQPPKLQPQSPQQQQPQPPKFQPQSPQPQQHTFGLRTPSAFQAQNPTPKAWAPVVTPASPQTPLPKAWNDVSVPHEVITTTTAPLPPQQQTVIPPLKDWNEKPVQQQPISTPPVAKQPGEYIIPIKIAEGTPQPQTVLPPLKTWNEKPVQQQQQPISIPPVAKPTGEYIIPIQIAGSTPVVQPQQQQQTVLQPLKTWNEKPAQQQPISTPPVTKPTGEHIIPIQIAGSTPVVQPQPQQQQTVLQPLKTWNNVPVPHEVTAAATPKPQPPQQQLPTLNKTWNEKPAQQQQTTQSPILAQQQQQPGEHIIPIQIAGGAWNSQHQGQSPQPQSQLHSTTAPHFEPPPAIITLRPEPPISQAPPPVFAAQPAATNPNSGSMRGDMKWPPQTVRDQTAAENQARLELAKGPVCRPRRVQKDYSSFFAQHASTNNYPGYRVPPGTQYFTPAYQQ